MVPSQAKLLDVQAALGRFSVASGTVLSEGAVALVISVEGLVIVLHLTNVSRHRHATWATTRHDSASGHRPMAHWKVVA